MHTDSNLVLINREMATAAVVHVHVGPVHGPLGMGLSPWTYERLVREVLIDQDTTIEWCKDVGLLARSMACHGCGGDMRWEATTEAKVDGYRLDVLVYQPFTLLS